MLVFSTVYPVLTRSRNVVRRFATQKKTRTRNEIKKFHQILGVAEDCADEVLRLAFVNLAKRFHPDSGTKEANATRFSEIESAYREIQRNRYERREEESKKNPDVEEFDIKHTAPQHRHYLADDVGIGTPSVRQRRYAAERAQRAMENVLEHRLKKIQATERNTLVGMDKQRAKDIKTRYGMDRLVEDLIQEAMNKGEFRDLPGSGKPLKDNACAQNPHVDFVTHKLNQVLIDNGFTPEWIQLSKEIREDKEDLKRQLVDARNRLGELPLSHEDEYQWERTLRDSRDTVQRINKKVDKFNLLVPILQKQMLQVNLKSLGDAVLAVPPDKSAVSNAKSNLSSTSDGSEGNFVQFFASLFGKQ
ncbi:dnaJ homolog subfamily C member 28 [Nasonia vitripennis]|uniref:J domain-containing protein n=1 Tax=Nasonia vitripennis TaxID=7425 RepID=A0A7M7HD51_NASVI|nr:dnaJ homolog subfamily C member 28 [Nasonia vitripennis]XP_008216883.1 dnaJ homolog subfamily C member 28 [Nasonia vitripennis]XP_032456016.1 dnaJ homolog subfamily C member 28 [Nasonia vitripennis]